jgi:hypothetical protein
MMQEQQSQEQQITSGVAWKIAKPILLADYLAGRATNNMWLREVIALHLEIYGKVLKAKNFGENWREMKERVGRDWKRSDEDEAIHLHDMTITRPWAYLASGTDPRLSDFSRKMPSHPMQIRKALSQAGRVSGV